MTFKQLAIILIANSKVNIWMQLLALLIPIQFLLPRITTAGSSISILNDNFTYDTTEACFTLNLKFSEDSFLCFAFSCFPPCQWCLNFPGNQILYEFVSAVHEKVGYFVWKLVLTKQLNFDCGHINEKNFFCILHSNFFMLLSYMSFCSAAANLGWVKSAAINAAVVLFISLWCRCIVMNSPCFSWSVDQCHKSHSQHSEGQKMQEWKLIFEDDRCDHCRKNARKFYLLIVKGCLLDSIYIPKGKKFVKFLKVNIRKYSCNDSNVDSPHLKVQICCCAAIPKHSDNWLCCLGQGLPRTPLQEPALPETKIKWSIYQITNLLNNRFFFNFSYILSWFTCCSLRKLLT